MAITVNITVDNSANIPQESLGQSRTFTAIGSDTADANAVFNYSWLLLDKPVGSTATLSAITGNGITITPDVWGSYRVFCIAENRDSGEVSQADPLRAPIEAFEIVSVESTKYDLEKPAKGQRNWHPQYRHLVDVVENLAGAGPATYVAGGTLEVGTPVDIAQGAGPGDSTSGNHYLAVSTEDLHTALHPTANGQISAGGHNVFRDKLKEIALEQINESSITELKDVDTTSQAPTAGQALVWSPTHVDDTNGDTGAWIPGDVAGSSNLFGAGLCDGETLNTLDFLIYQEDCQEVPVAGAIPGWHARNKYSGSEFSLNFPYASNGRAGTTWMSTAEAAGTGTWDDNREHPGMVSIASIYNTARGRGYDADVYSNASAVQAAVALGTLPSFAMSPLNFAQCLIGQSFTGPSGVINNVVVDTNKDGESIALYDPSYHTAAEISDLVADAAANTTFDGTAINLIQQALSTHHLLRLGRSSITRLADVDTTTHAPANGDLLYWDATATDDSGIQQTGAWVPKSLSEIGISGGGVDGLTSNSTDTITIDSGYSIVPFADNTHVLGADDKKFQRIYVNELTGDSGSSDGLDTRLSLNAEIPGSAASGLRAAALYSRGSIAMMIDTNNTGNADTNAFYVYEGAEDDSAANERFRVENDGTVRINDAYNMPLSDGSPNQILQTNGSGQLSFVDNSSSSSGIEGTFDQCHLGTFTDEITYNNSGYTVGLGRSPIMFMFRNPYDVALNLKQFTFTCSHMHSTTLNFSFAVCTHAQLLQNIYATNSIQFTLNKVNIDPNTNNEGIGSLEGTIGNQLAAGEYLVVLLNGFEKTGQDNERFFINVEYTD